MQFGPTCEIFNFVIRSPAPPPRFSSPCGGGVYACALRFPRAWAGSLSWGGVESLPRGACRCRTRTKGDVTLVGRNGQERVKVAPGLVEWKALEAGGRLRLAQVEG